MQKEYPTADRLDKSKRQHRDIAVIKSPAESICAEAAAYDYLKLAAAVEFGMNAPPEHLEEDIRRLTHQEANLRKGFVVHAYRLSEPDMLFSNRDWSPNSSLILRPKDIKKMSEGKSVEIFYAMADATGTYPSEALHISRGKCMACI
ncbi:MAG: hypothetical protein D3924_00080 [Candidatus Electrothrix sp. AR4]|nr:hypothetical protein [Candidatus Electrothrix sp. AR4]